MDNFDKVIFDWICKWGVWLAGICLALCVLAECGRRVGWAWMS